MQKIRVGAAALLAGTLLACSSSSSSGVGDLAGSGDASAGTDQAGLADMSGADLGPGFAHYTWARRFGDSESELVNGLAVDPSGNVFVGGSFSGTVSFGGAALVSAGGTDLFLAKFAPDGTALWSQRFGGSGDDYAAGVAVTASGDVVLFAGFEGTVSFGGGDLTSAGYTDAVLAKYSSAGAHLWSRRIGGSELDDALSVAVDPAGNVLLTGSFAGTASFAQTMLSSAGNSDTFVSKWSGDGTHLWSKRFGSTDFDRGHSIAADSSGNILVAGEFYLTANFGGAALTSAGVGDIFVTKLTPDGTHLWSRAAGGSYSDTATSITVDPSGNVLVTGTFGGTIDLGNGPLTQLGGGTDIFVAKYQPSGTPVWSKRLGGPSTDTSFSITSDSSGSVILGGNFFGSCDFGGGALTASGYLDGFLAKYSPSGIHLWSSRFGATGSTEFSSVIAVGAAPGGDVLAGGNFTDVTRFYDTPLTSAGQLDVFVLRRAP